MADAEALLQGMVEGLARRGELDEQWRAAFTEVSRHEFIPELVWRHDRHAGTHGDLVPLRRDEDPQGWLEGAYANAPVNTQVDDGHPIGETGWGFEVTSSASMAWSRLAARSVEGTGVLDRRPAGVWMRNRAGGAGRTIRRGVSWGCGSAARGAVCALCPAMPAWSRSRTKGRASAPAG